jgi:hypothetical protein
LFFESATAPSSRFYQIGPDRDEWRQIYTFWAELARGRVEQLSSIVQNHVRNGHHLKANRKKNHAIRETIGDNCSTMDPRTPFGVKRRGQHGKRTVAALREKGRGLSMTLVITLEKAAEYSAAHR